MAISSYRAGYQPLKAPATTIRTYGTAGKWTAEAVRSRSSTANASDLFFGPQQTGPDWAAQFSSINGGAQTDALKDYVKRNVDKFSGGTLQGMLEATGLVDWYKQKMKDDMDAAAKSIQESIDATDLSSLMSDRSKLIMSSLKPTTKAAPPWPPRSSRLRSPIPPRRPPRHPRRRRRSTSRSDHAACPRLDWPGRARRGQSSPAGAVLSRAEARLSRGSVLMSMLMSLWTRLSEIVARLPGAEAVAGAFDRVVEAVRATVSPQERREVAFTIAMIALSAKMAKADGVVTSDEISVVKRLLIVPEAERANVARLFNLAKQDAAGFEAYARRIEALCHDQPELLEDVLDGLFVIAGADGLVHDRERDFLERVADIFHVSTAAFGRIMARHVKPEETDPFVVLGVPRTATPEDVKRAWRRQVAENHPDRLHSRGVPAECIRLATERVAALNAAYDRIEREFA